MFTYGSIQQCCERCCSTNAPNERIQTNKFERENERIVTAANRKVNRMSQRVSWKYYSTSEGMIKRTEQQCYTHKPRKLRTNNHQPNNPTNARTMNDRIIDRPNEQSHRRTNEPTVCTLLLTITCIFSGYIISTIAPTITAATSLGPPLMLPLLIFGGFFLKST